MADVQTTRTTTTRTRAVDEGFSLPILGRVTMWKLIVLQDILVLGFLGLSALVYPAWLITWQARIAGMIGFPPASWLTKSDTIVMMLSGE